VRTAINVGGGAVGPRLRVRIIGEGTHPEDTVLLNERPFANNVQDRIARFQDIDRIEVENLTFDVGSGNPGAVGLQFYSNNSGAVRDCRFVAGEGSGWIGLINRVRDGVALVPRRFKLGGHGPS
jgi:hypothetical protein